MQTVRRFLVLTPVAFVVTLVVYLVQYAVFNEGESIWSVLGIALLVALLGTAIVLASVLIAVGLLRLLGVSNAWAALGLAVGMILIVLVIHVAVVGISDEWGMLFVQVAVMVQAPGWLAFAVGLLVGDLRARAARNRAGLAA